MRRKDREVTDTNRIKEIIRECHICRIGFNDNGEVYIVPLNFGYEVIDGNYILYFHSAKEGRKIDLIEKSPHVGFEMDTGYQLVTADIACGHSALYQSIIGNGIIGVVEDTSQKQHGLRLIMEHETGKSDWNFNEKMLGAVTVFRLTVTALSCKEH